MEMTAHRLFRPCVCSWGTLAIAPVAIVLGLSWLWTAASAQQPKQEQPGPAATPAAAAKAAPGAKAAPKAAEAKAAPQDAAAAAARPAVTQPGAEPTPVTKPAAPAAGAKPAETKPPETKPAPGAGQPAAPAPPSGPIEYKVEMTDEDYDKLAERIRKERTKATIQKVLRGTGFQSQKEEDDFVAYYESYGFPRWAVKKEYPSLPDFRKELRNELLTAKSGPIYDRLLGLALKHLARFSGPGYHPAVRYNAMLMLGDLNVQEFAPGAKNPIVPLPEALKLIVQAVEKSDSDAVKVAALLGLMRHASEVARSDQIKVGLGDPAIRDKQVVPMLLDLAKSLPPPRRSADGHAWMRALAIDILAQLRTPGPNGEVVTALVGLMGDKKTPLTVRTAAARALGSMDYQNFTALSPSQLATALGQLTVDLVAIELSRAGPGAKPGAKAGAGTTGLAPSMGMMPGAMPPMMPGAAGRMSPQAMMSRMMASPTAYGASGTVAGQPADEEEEKERVLQFRRRLKQHLNAVRLGINGPADTAVGGIRALRPEKTPDRDFADRVWENLRDQMKELDKGDIDYPTLAKAIQGKRDGLVAILKAGPGAAPAKEKEPAKATSKAAASPPAAK